MWCSCFCPIIHPRRPDQWSCTGAARGREEERRGREKEKKKEVEKKDIQERKTIRGLGKELFTRRLYDAAAAWLASI